MKRTIIRRPAPIQDVSRHEPVMLKRAIIRRPAERQDAAFSSRRSAGGLLFTSLAATAPSVFEEDVFEEGVFD